jgi:hypothetical protein
MMDNAGHTISSAASGLAYTLADLLSIDLLKQFNVGIQVVFIQPDTRYDKVVDESTASASSMGAMIGIFIFASGSASLALHYRPKKVIYSKSPEVSKKDNEGAMFIQEEERLRRESTKPMTFKFTSTVGGFRQRHDSVGNPVNMDNPEHQRDNSLFQNQLLGLKLRNPEVDEKPESLFWDVLKCFSIPENLYSLTYTKRTVDDDPELDALEGIKVLTMCWAIITATSLYTLTVSARNIVVMIDLFKQYLFAIVASGNIAPDLFMFMIYFIGFIKLNQYYDRKNGIGLGDYFTLYLHRYLKIAPLYYFVFFFGWIILPIASRTSNWFLSDRLFHD